MGSTNLQALFADRLRSERVHFVTLSAALARAEESPASIFDALNFRAHRLRGAAATFEYVTLASVAGTLERASKAAAASQAEHTDAEVWAALMALVDMLGVFGEDAIGPPSIDMQRLAG